MRQLGRNQSALTLPLVPRLLSTHPYFETLEPDINDPAYTAILIMVFNAAVSCPTMLPLFPDHTFQHYTFLRRTLPDLVPTLPMSEGGQFCPKPVAVPSTRPSTASAFLSETVQRLAAMTSMDSGSARELISLGIRDLSRVSQIDPSLAATAECLSMFLQCQLCLSQRLEAADWMSQLGTDVMADSVVVKVIRLTHNMEHLFRGLRVADIASIRQLRLRAQTLHLLAILTTNKTTSCKPSCVQYLQVLNDLQRLLLMNNLKADNFAQSLFAETHRLESCEPSVYLPLLRVALQRHRPYMLHLDNQLQRASADILEPSGVSEHPLKFMAGLTVAVTLVAQINEVENIQDVRIKLRYPDSEEHLVVPTLTDFRQQNPQSHSIRTNVTLSHGLWTEPSYVELSIIAVYPTDTDVVSGETLTAGPSKATTRTDGFDYIELCAPVKVNIEPKPCRR
ncbi:hypothetical protein NP493_28g05019 [Ridgeia piscesae]|uniref:Uncharacterized protein n=1 Tax=Ridgeia piscesae TaxID=27915 RepID=A0AAD9PDH5_RIDPI|nr:hypothetical protein NP493_28g05019 [Ridgeia piscesae]